MHMTNLKPDVFLVQWPWWIGHNVFEALQGRCLAESRPAGIFPYL